MRFLGVIVCNAGHNESFHFTIMQAEAVSLTRWRGGHVGINAYCDDTYMYTGVHSMRTVCLIELEINFKPIKVGEVVDDICMPYLRYVRDMKIWPIVVKSRADLITSGNGSLANWSNFCCYMEQLRLRPFPVSHYNADNPGKLKTRRQTIKISYFLRKLLMILIDTLSIGYRNY